MEEIWKDIPGYEGKYQVSSFGRVRSIDRIDDENHFRKGQIMKLNTLRGYKRVPLRDGKKQRSLQVHRLVAIAFIPNPLNLPQVNHKDCDPGNNRVENLEWCTSKYNNNYGDSRKKKSKALKGKRHEYSWVPVLCYTMGWEFVKRYDNIVDAAEETKARAGAISACCKGRKRLSAGGYKWKYAS